MVAALVALNLAVLRADVPTETPAIQVYLAPRVLFKQQLFQIPSVA
jgi:hypothetical protein